MRNLQCWIAPANVLLTRKFHVYSCIHVAIMFHCSTTTIAGVRSNEIINVVDSFINMSSPFY